VVKTDRQMNHTLQEQPAHASLRPPQVLEHFMTLEKLAPIEQLDTAMKTAGHLSGCARNHSSVKRKPSSNVKLGTYPSSVLAAVVSAWESRTSPERGGP